MISLIKSLSLCAAAVFLTACARQDGSVISPGVRVVSLAPSITEMIYAVGAGSNLVGRTSACTYPDEVLSVPVVGGFGMPSLETLVKTRPDYVLEAVLGDDSLGRKIDQLGLKRINIECKRLADIPAALRQIGAIVGRQQASEALAARLEGEIAGVMQSVPDAECKPRILVEIWGDPVMAAGCNSFISDIIKLAGGVNVGDEGESDYFATSSEWVVDRNPDIIICLYMDKRYGPAEMVKRRPGWQQINAVKNGRVYDGLPNDVLLRPGPRVMKGIEAVKSIIKESDHREDMQ